MHCSIPILSVVALLTSGCSLYSDSEPTYERPIGDEHSKPDEDTNDAPNVPETPGAPMPPDVPDPPEIPNIPEVPDPPEIPDTCPVLADSPVILNCNTEAQYREHSWRADEVAGTALHVVSIYETHSEHSAGNHPMGEAEILFSLPGSNVLALSSYEPVHWYVHLTPGAELEKIIVIGYHEQQITAPASIEIEIYDYISRGDVIARCPRELTEGLGACPSIEELTGLQVASFDACYNASQFEFVATNEDACTPPTADEVIKDCGTDGYSFRTGESAATRLWLGAVYETRSDHSGGYHPMGEANVEFTLPGSNVLALSAYEPTTWNISVANDAALDRIVVFGYHEQIVSAPADIPIEIHDHKVQRSEYWSCGYSYPYNGGGCDTDELIANAEFVTGLPIFGFDGCYHATSFIYSTE